MSLIKRGVNGEEPNQSAELEEQYKRLMPKIGRDFVTHDDLNTIITRILELIPGAEALGLTVDKVAARDLAERYKSLVEKGKDGGESQRDLVKIDEDE